MPFICGLDGNKTPAEWSKVKWGSVNFLDHVNAEIVVVTNSDFTCRGKAGTTGGSMIDYFLVSKVLLGLIVSVLADFSSEWSPHYGIELRMRADLLEIENLALGPTFSPEELGRVRC